LGAGRELGRRDQGVEKYDQEEDRLKAYGIFVSLILRSNAIHNIIDFSIGENQVDIVYA
jgi:hypothetical protein